jgi:hypothetical protein
MAEARNRSFFKSLIEDVAEYSFTPGYRKFLSILHTIYPWIDTERITMKVNIYIEKSDFDAFFVWINRLNHGILTSTPIKYSTEASSIKKPLQISLEPNMYALIVDAETDLKSLQTEYGEVNISFEPLSKSWELRTIKDILRNSKRYDMDPNVVYTALYTMAQVPGISPAEAMIIAEREWIGSLESSDNPDI